MGTVNSWLNPIHQELELSYPLISSQNRLTTPSPSLDGIFVLGKGFVLFANSPFTFPAVDQAFKQMSNINWFFADTQSDNLMVLFLLLTNATANIAETYLDPSVSSLIKSYPSIFGEVLQSHAGQVLSVLKLPPTSREEPIDPSARNGEYLCENMLPGTFIPQDQGCAMI